MSLFGAVDPGNAGALVVVDGERQPVLVWAADKGTTDGDPGYLAGDFDARAFVQRLRGLGRFVSFIIETPFALASGGTSNALTTGTNYGQILACLAVAEVPYTKVTPASWSAKMIGAPPKGGWPAKAKKQAAIDLCRRELPALPLILPRCRVPHDGIADAGAMALYGMQKWGRS